MGASSTHITFLNNLEAEKLKKLGWLIRKDQQFHWKNNNYSKFGDVLEELKSSKRNMIKKLTIIVLFSILLVSCGKKGCPKYSDSDNEKCDPIFKN